MAFAMSRLSKVAIAVLLLTCLAFYGCSRSDDRLQTSFRKISVGMSYEQVVALVGQPRWRGRCGADYVFVQARPGGGSCLEYASAFAPLNPWYPVVFLNAGGRVEGKYEFASP